MPDRACYVIRYTPLGQHARSGQIRCQTGRPDEHASHLLSRPKRERAARSTKILSTLDRERAGRAGGTECPASTLDCSAARRLRHESCPMSDTLEISAYDARSARESEP